ncbi:MAG: methionyl-tRNA formyltransferase [Bacteroidales bacterium]|nr:methionyl-tRNA formyltransferase [Bacteroidales bacterium]
MSNKTKDKFRIIFMGTPDFAVESLKSLQENGFNIIGVITAPDKPAGRGKKLQASAVKKYATENNLALLQPANLKNEQFIEDLKALKADLNVVVAFRMLPEVVWDMPEFGTINLHASLLPNYRGAAPINHAIINGESITGVTTFFIEKKIDTGNIIFQEKVNILPNETAGELHDKLMFVGGELIVKTVETIIKNEVNAISQKQFSKETDNLKPANKIFKENCKINWDQSIDKVYNFIRGLSPYPTAWTKMVNIGSKDIISVKIFLTEKISDEHNFLPGSIISDNKNFIKIATRDGYISLKALQIQGKKQMNVKELLNGFDISKFQTV